MTPEQRQRIREAAKLAARRHSPGCLRDLGCLAGYACVLYGIAQYSTPAAWITGGLLVALFSAAASRAASRAASEQRKKGPH